MVPCDAAKATLYERTNANVDVDNWSRDNVGMHCVDKLIGSELNMRQSGDVHIVIRKRTFNFYSGGFRVDNDSAIYFHRYTFSNLECSK